MFKQNPTVKLDINLACDYDEFERCVNCTCIYMHKRECTEGSVEQFQMCSHLVQQLQNAYNLSITKSWMKFTSLNLLWSYFLTEKLRKLW